MITLQFETGGGLHRAFIAFVVLLCVPAHSAAQTAERVVAVVPLDDGAASRQLDLEVIRVLEPTGLAAVGGSTLDDLLSNRRVDVPDTAVVESVQASTRDIAQGVESFFYMSPERAVALLKPVIDSAWLQPHVLAFRPDLSDQVWQAGLVLIRAALETGGGEEAESYALRILTLLPSRVADPKMVPPDARAVLDRARADLARGGTTLSLEALSPDCTVSLNGGIAMPGVAYTVDPRGKYFVQSDCSLASTPPVWSVDLDREKNQMLVPAISPERFRLVGTDPASRRDAEWHLRALAELTRVPTVVGVGSQVAGDDSVVLARYEYAEQLVTWSDDNYADSIRRGVPVIFPEYAGLLETGPVERPRRAVDLAAVAFAGGGVVAGGTGTFLIWSAGRQSHLLDCAVNNPDPPSVDCANVSGDTFFEDFDGEKRKVGVVRVVGWTLVGVGAVAIGYGVYRWIRGRPVKSTSLAITSSGVAVRW